MPRPSRNRIFAWLLVAAALMALLACGRKYGENITPADGDEDREASEIERDESDSGYPGGPYGLTVGSTMEDFELGDCEGAPVRLSDFYGESKAILINQSAGWCKTCNQETPTLEEWYQELGDSGVLIIQALFQNSSGAPANEDFCRLWVKRHEVSFPVVVDPQNLFLGYHPSIQNGSPQYGTPLNIILDREMTIRYLIEGEMPPDMRNHLITLTEDR